MALKDNEILQLIEHIKLAYNKVSVKNSVIDTEKISKLRQNAYDYFLNMKKPFSELSDSSFYELEKAYKNDMLDFESDQIDDISAFCDAKGLKSTVIGLINGRYKENLFTANDVPEGVIITSLNNAIAKYPELVNKHIAQGVNNISSSFEALNLALFTDGLFIYVPENVVIETPIQLVDYVNVKDNSVQRTRNLIILDKNSKMKLIHCSHSNEHVYSCINAVTEVFIDDNATMEHYKTQNLDRGSLNYNRTHFDLKKESKISSYTITLNGGVIKNKYTVDLKGEFGNADLNGLYLADKRQIVDNNIFIKHTSPNCTSNQLFKGILDDSAKAIFKGLVYVEKNAQKTLAYQNNRNILLNDKAQIHTKPHLEIYADDVKCSHGSTVGQLNEEALFYMQSRGMSKETARLLLVIAFASEITENIGVEAIKNKIQNSVNLRLKGKLSACDGCFGCGGGDCDPPTFDLDIQA